MWQSDLAEKNAVIEYRQKNTDTILTMPASNEILMMTKQRLTYMLPNLVT